MIRTKPPGKQVWRGQGRPPIPYRRRPMPKLRSFALCVAATLLLAITPGPGSSMSLREPSLADGGPAS